MSLPKRRFGRTNINMPVLSLGGMRFQKSWDQLQLSEISKKEQERLEDILKLANQYGFNHIETAKDYGTSELQLGFGFQNIGHVPGILQTKIPPNNDVNIFEEAIVKSFESLRVKKIDLIAIHGINNLEHLHQACREGGCVDVLKKWQKDKLIGHIGFSTHAESSLIEKVISTNLFEYVNLHWYFINQNNSNVIDLARKYD